MVSEPIPHIDYYISHRQRREEQIVSLLQQSDQSALTIVQVQNDVRLKWKYITKKPLGSTLMQYLINPKQNCINCVKKTQAIFQMAAIWVFDARKIIAANNFSLACGVASHSNDCVQVLYKNYPVEVHGEAADVVLLHLQKLQGERRVKCRGDTANRESLWTMSMPNKLWIVVYLLSHFQENSGHSQIALNPSWWLFWLSQRLFKPTLTS